MKELKKEVVLVDIIESVDVFFFVEKFEKDLGGFFKYMKILVEKIDVFFIMQDLEEDE